jgi:LysM repeat protein
MLPAGCRVEILERRPAWLGVRSQDSHADVTGFVEVARIACVDVEGRGFLAADSSLQRAEVEAPPDRRLAAGGGAQEAAVARAWNLYGGLLGTLSARLGVDPANAVAVVCVESSGQGFGPDGRLVIRLENHIFRRALSAAEHPAFDRHFQVGAGQPWMDHRFRARPDEPFIAFHGSQALEWRAFEVARAINEDAATRSISMGLPQVMGFNHALLGYPSARDMLAFMSADVRFQLLGLFDFVAGTRGDGPAIAALRRGDFDGFATLYNGPGQARFYGELIAAHVRAFRRLKPAPLTTPAPTATSAATASPVVPGSPGAASRPPSGPRTYTVRSGDSLGLIAGRLGVTVAEIVALNGIANPNLVQVGQVLRIPAAEPPPAPVVVPSAPPEDVTAAGEQRVGDAYIVRPGDTLGAIAARARTTVAALTTLNSITNADVIFPGQVLRLPPPSS